MSERTVAVTIVLLSSLPLAAPAQEAADSTLAASTSTEVFWDTVPALVPIRVIQPPGFVSGEPHTLIVALHGYGSSAEKFSRVGERLARAGFLVAVPEAPYTYITKRGELGFSWGLYQTGDPDLDRKAFELLVTESMPELVRTLQKRYTVERTYLLGFSQGAIAAMLAGIYSYDSLDGLIAFGLAAYEPAWFQLPDLKPALASGQQLSILLVHGEEDDRAPLAISERARDHPAGLGYEVTLRAFSGRHTVPDAQLDFVAGWLRGGQP